MLKDWEIKIISKKNASKWHSGRNRKGVPDNFPYLRWEKRGKVNKDGDGVFILYRSVE